MAVADFQRLLTTKRMDVLVTCSFCHEWVSKVQSGIYQISSFLCFKDWPKTTVVWQRTSPSQLDFLDILTS